MGEVFNLSAPLDGKSEFLSSTFAGWDEIFMMIKASYVWIFMLMHRFLFEMSPGLSFGCLPEKGTI